MGNEENHAHQSADPSGHRNPPGRHVHIPLPPMRARPGIHRPRHLQVPERRAIHGPPVGRLV